MATMVERVAKTICCPNGCVCDQEEPCHAYQVEAVARAAIVELLVPTPTMLEAGREANALTKTNVLGLEYFPPDLAWNAMVKEAMK